MFRRKKKSTDTLVVLDGTTWQVRDVVAQDELAVSDGDRTWPKTSLTRYWDEKGRVVWLANAPRETLIAAQQLEQVRRSNVLKHVFSYQKPLPNINFVIYIGLLVALIVAIWRG